MIHYPHQLPGGAYETTAGGGAGRFDASFPCRLRQRSADSGAISRAGASSHCIRTLSRADTGTAC